MSARRVVSITGTRADYGLMRSVHTGIMACDELELVLLVTGMHLLPRFELGMKEIQASGYPFLLVAQSGSGKSMSEAIGYQLLGLSEALNELKPDVVLLQGDRGEMLAAAIAAVHLNIPIVHMSGGDRSGTIDESLRAAVSKLAHLHLTTCDDSSRNLAAMGESTDRIFTVGEPALDSIFESAAAGESSLAEVGLDITRPYILATQHPVTTEASAAADQMRVTLCALERVGLPTVFTHPNSDIGGQEMVDVLESYRDRPWLKIVPTLGANRFLAALKHAAVLVGNSSSGIIEAPSFGTPVVNIGTRQYARVRAANVIDVDHDEIAIRAAIQHARFDKEFRERLAGCTNPYGDGRAAERTVSILRRLNLSPELVAKWLPGTQPILIGTGA